jgi:hypothetical protein
VIWANSAQGSAPPVIWDQEAPISDRWFLEPTLTSAADGIIAAINVNGPPAPTPAQTPGAPHCTFGASGEPASYGQLTIQCTPDSYNDPILIFAWQPATSSWGSVAQWGSFTPVGAGQPGSTVTYLGCSYNAEYYPTVPEADFASVVAPGLQGCDAVAQAVTGPAAYSFSVASGTLYTPGTEEGVVSVTVSGQEGLEFDLSMSALPSGVTGYFAPAVISPYNVARPKEVNAATLMLSATSAVPTGTFTLVVTATNTANNVSSSFPVTINVVPSEGCVGGGCQDTGAKGECEAAGGVWANGKCIKVPVPKCGDLPC